MTEEKSSFTVDPRKYRAGRNSSGRLSLNNGDPVAVALQGLSLESALKITAEVTGLSVSFLEEKHGHMKPGPRRMAMGNMIRGTINRMNKDEPGLGDKYLADVAAPFREAAGK